jgi:radical SAM protein with 4Fe4S-binding SPASM domain
MIPLFSRNANRRNHRPRLLLQWHITERCNLRCSHCYQDTYAGPELSFRDLLDVLQQFKDLLDTLSPGQRRLLARGHVTVTGGEPFVRRDFLDFLEVLSVNKSRFSFAILTNGSFIDAAMARQLSHLNPTFVQVSIEGSQTTHDDIRGTGNFDRTISAVKHLVRARVRTLVSFTAHRGNFREFPEVALLASRLGAARVWADRIIPAGTGKDLEKQVLTPEETQELFRLMRKARQNVKRSFWGRTEVAMHRALQFLEGGHVYHCTAGECLITVQPNGDLYPCRRMPIRIGNLLETPLVDLYKESSLFRALRNRDKTSKGCQDCSYSGLCRGGLKCLSYAMTGDPFTADPGCWLANPDRK